MAIWRFLYFLTMLTSSLSSNDWIEFNVPPSFKNIQSHLERQLYILKLANILNEDLLHYNESDEETTDDDDTDDDISEESDNRDDQYSLHYRSFEELSLSSSFESSRLIKKNILKNKKTKNKLPFKSTNKDIRSETSWLKSNINETINTFKYFNISSSQGTALRSRWNKSCDEKASKACQRACKSALKTVCEEYRCKSNQKRAFKKNCKTNCKHNFTDDNSKEKNRGSGESCGNKK